jgi:hypothetical protein
MRSDMFEIIIERPRINCARGGRLKGRKAELARGRAELSPRTEPMSINRGTKYLNENLAPLRRFLERSVGRPWDAVRSEIAEHIAARSAVQKHVLDHVKQMVETSPVILDGRPHDPNGSGPRRDRYTPLASYRRYGFYVCPRTGLLKLAPPLSRKAPPPTPDVRPLGEMVEARRIEGVWYLVTLAKVPTDSKVWKDCYDVIVKARLAEPSMMGWNGGLKQAHGRTDQYAVAKRQLSKREIRAHDLG